MSATNTSTSTDTSIVCGIPPSSVPQRFIYVQKLLNNTSVSQQVTCCIYFLEAELHIIWNDQNHLKDARNL